MNHKEEIERLRAEVAGLMACRDRMVKAIEDLKEYNRLVQRRKRERKERLCMLRKSSPSGV